MKYDLAKLMNENLNSINKIKKTSFVPPVIPVIFLGVEIVSSSMTAAAAATALAEAGAILTAGTGLIAATIFSMDYIDQRARNAAKLYYDGDESLDTGIGYGESPDDGGGHGYDDYIEELREGCNAGYEEDCAELKAMTEEPADPVEITEDDLIKEGVSEDDIEQIKVNLEKFVAFKKTKLKQNYNILGTKEKRPEFLNTDDRDPGSGFPSDSESGDGNRRNGAIINVYWMAYTKLTIGDKLVNLDRSSNYARGDLYTFDYIYVKGKNSAEFGKVLCDMFKKLSGQGSLVESIPMHGLVTGLTRKTYDRSTIIRFLEQAASSIGCEIALISKNPYEERDILYLEKKYCYTGIYTYLDITYHIAESSWRFGCRLKTKYSKGGSGFAIFSPEGNEYRVQSSC